MYRRAPITAFAALVCAFLIPTPARAGGMISLTQGSTKVNGYLALPSGEGTYPALVVIQ